jgi:hypoxanthine phosphoribosyltransferase
MVIHHQPPAEEVIHPDSPSPFPFTHPIEAEFARILDYYGIEWAYEPHTFALEWDENGQVVEAFSPDFYLPQQERYIELTTMRPKLITKKNRKIRRLQELYPAINIKLFKRSDLRDMMLKYGMDEYATNLAGTEAQSKRR